MAARTERRFGAEAAGSVRDLAFGVSNGSHFRGNRSVVGREFGLSAGIGCLVAAVRSGKCEWRRTLSRPWQGRPSESARDDSHRGLADGDSRASRDSRAIAPL